GVVRLSHEDHVQTWLDVLPCVEHRHGEPGHQSAQDLADLAILQDPPERDVHALLLARPPVHRAHLRVFRYGSGARAALPPSLPGRRIGRSPTTTRTHLRALRARRRARCVSGLRPAVASLVVALVPLRLRETPPVRCAYLRVFRYGSGARA